MSTARTINAVLQNGTSINVYVDKYPGKCPVCHHAQEPHYIGYAFRRTVEGIKITQAVFRCSNLDCLSVFIAEYADLLAEDARLSKLYPVSHVEKSWGPHVEKISPNFVKIYNQASSAESGGLDEISGPGYRKALEFLVKDWLIKEIPAEADAITKKQLGECITDYISEAAIQESAARAAWLGNDQTHYYKIWNDKDISDLKQLIELTAHWIEMKELHTSLVEEMPGKKGADAKKPTSESQKLADREAA